MEAATSPEPKSAPKSRSKGPTTVARAYFEAINERDLDAAAAMWDQGGIDYLHGMAELSVPAGFKQYFRQLFDAFPDFDMQIVTIAASKENAAVRWRLTGSFDGPGKFEGMNANGASVELEGCDMLTIRDGKILENHAYVNATDLARQLGAMPPAGSIPERGMIGAFNAKTAIARIVRDLRNR